MDFRKFVDVDYLYKSITWQVFGVRRSYLVCILLIRDVLRKNKHFDEKIFFPMKNLDKHFRHFSNFSILGFFSEDFGIFTLFMHGVSKFE